MSHSTANDTNPQSSQQATASASHQHEATEQEEEKAFIEQIVNSTSYMTPSTSFVTIVFDHMKLTLLDRVEELLERLDGDSFLRWVEYNLEANKIDDAINEAKDR